jgi:hypothetical protein
MFHVVNTYTRAAAMDGLPAESSYRLQRVGGNILGLLNQKNKAGISPAPPLIIINRIIISYFHNPDTGEAKSLM